MPKCPNCGCTWNETKKKSQNRKADPMKRIKRGLFDFSLPMFFLMVIALLLLKVYLFGG